MTEYKCRGCSRAVEKEGETCEVCKLRFQPDHQAPRNSRFYGEEWIVLSIAVTVVLCSFAIYLYMNYLHRLAHR